MIQTVITNYYSSSEFSLNLTFAGADPGFGQGGAPASETETSRRSEAESCE